MRFDPVLFHNWFVVTVVLILKDGEWEFITLREGYVPEDV